MQNDATTAIDLFGPFNWSQNGGDLRYEPEKVRKNGTQKKCVPAESPPLLALCKKVRSTSTDTKPIQVRKNQRPVTSQADWNAKMRWLVSVMSIWGFP
ncbi:hypothetical protein ACIU3T_002145 [Escherichia coli]|nr:hypothetical protein [Escherichia coli]MCN6369955.1 hypothetical protein [Escherichia coli]MCX1168761.1 hypothetical protein [Escherichia coli]HEG2057054.1 hypothetical protein [Escherichia coli]